MSIFSRLFSRKNWRTRRFWRENWMKERRDIIALKWKTSLLMKINSHCWLRTALQRLNCIFIILWKYSNNRRTGLRRLLTFTLHVRRLIDGGAYSSKYGICKMSAELICNLCRRSADEGGIMSKQNNRRTSPIKHLLFLLGWLWHSLVTKRGRFFLLTQIALWRVQRVRKMQEYA